VNVDEFVPVLSVHQYGQAGPEDLLYVFAAPAKVLVQWAGVPKKGWRIRMLYQRWVTERRQKELSEFWERAARPRAEIGQKHILGPTAITVAIQGAATITDGKLRLQYAPPLDFTENSVNNLQRVAELVAPKVRSRLSQAQQTLLADFERDPQQPLPSTEHDYVFEFALQLAQIRSSARWFVEQNNIGEDEQREMVVALESLCRPALIVDGQHRLLGAAEANVPVILPVVAIPNTDWVEQIYQFIVINEKAQKVETSLLTDIFGSSLTRDEQHEIRDRLSRAKVDVEARIAAVVSDRDPASPFYRMVNIKLSGAAASTGAYITEMTVRLLIDGNARHSRGWRSDDELWEQLVQPLYPDRAQWDAWTDGAWRKYWFKFWSTVRDYYNDQAQKERQQALWASDRQTNLTKAVTLRILQKLFIDKMIENVKIVERTRPILVEALGEEAAEVHLREKQREFLFPSDLDAFATYVRTRFLNYLPVRIFLNQWVKSLDDEQGRENLYAELEKAFDRLSQNKGYRAQNTEIYAVARDEQE
jgi:hypothetical protein